MVTTQQPVIEVVSDYDGFFEGLVRSWVDQHRGEFKNTRIVITSGPYRAYDVRFEATEPGILKFDFYSVCRIRGGPDLSEADTQELVALL